MPQIAAVVLAAGLSSRMGQPKALLAWREGETIIEKIVKELRTAEITPIVVVAGSVTPQIRLLVTPLGAEIVHNPDYETGEMLSSLKAGLRTLNNADASLVVMGDQPRIQADTVRRVCAAYSAGKLAAPVYKGVRGHPILIDRAFWDELLRLEDKKAPREVIARHRELLVSVEVDDDSVVSDVDTPEQYAAERSKAGLPPLPPKA